VVDGRFLGVVDDRVGTQVTEMVRDHGRSIER
jgi:hypothetical protein